MITVRNTNHFTLRGRSAVGVLLALTATKALTALVMSFPLVWLVNHVFGAGAIQAIFGADRLSYLRCVGLFAIWFAAQVKIKISGPAQIEIEGER